MIARATIESLPQVYEEAAVWPDISHLITEDDTPVDNILSEKEQRILVDPLYSSWSGPPPEEDGVPRPFLVLANVGLFFTPENNALVPDVMLSVDTRVADDLDEKGNRSYFAWLHGKPPDVVIEIVSNDKGGELDVRLKRYRRARVPFYVVHDPLHCLGEETLRVFELTGGRYKALSVARFEIFGLALTEWHGTFEGHTRTWLRWCTLDGEILPTGAERAEQERKRAEQERKRAEQERLRAKKAGKRAEEEYKRAEQERLRAEEAGKRAEEERKRAEEAEERVRHLQERLRAAGVDPGK